MEKIDLVAVKALRYAGVSMAAGDSFSARLQDAKIYIALGWAKEAEKKPTPVVAKAEVDPCFKPEISERKEAIQTVLSAADDALKAEKQKKPKKTPE